MKTFKKPEVFVIMNVFLIALFYTVVLYGLPDCVPGEYWLYEDDWRMYLVTLTKITLTAVLLIKAYQKSCVEGKWKAGAVLFAGAFFVSVLGMMYDFEYLLFGIQRMLVIHWPFLIICVAEVVRRMEKKHPLEKWKYGVFLYYGVVTALIWLMKDVCVCYDRYHSSDLVQIIYLLLCAAFVWNLKGKKKGRDSWVWILTIVSFVLLCLHHERATEILNSLTNPMTEVYGNDGEVNWLANRLAMMKQIWLGNMDSYEYRTSIAAYSCPLAIVKEVFGYAGTVLMLVLEGSLLYQVYAVYKARKPKGTVGMLCKTVFFAIAAWSSIDLITNILLIYSYGVGLPLLASYEGYMLILFFLYLSRMAGKGDVHECI